MPHSFLSWVRHRHATDNLTAQADKIVPLVAASASGMNRKQLGHAIKLDRDVLDELLDGLVQVGILSVVWENGVAVFRTQNGRG